MSEGGGTAWQNHYLDCLEYVRGMVRAADAGRAIPLGPSTLPLTAPPVSVVARKLQPPARVVFCAPHPDDESLSGALALRLRLDSGASVTNVAITLGSDASQRARRLRELESACRALGFKLVVAGEEDVETSAQAAKPAACGFDHVNLKGKQDSQAWAAKIDGLRRIFDREEPDIVFMPHAEDFNTTHVGTHHLVIDALGGHLERTGRAPVMVIETEFWHQIERPNLMVGLTPETVAMQLVAIAEHGDEMRRNPYHLLHPCRLMDNVRRGSEVVCGEGAAAQRIVFAELYCVREMRGTELADASPGGHVLSPGEKASLDGLREKFFSGPAR